MSWTHANLETQGYRLGGDEARALRIGLRFPTALCLALVVTGLALESALMIALLVPIGAIAGWTPRHPFDLIWNHGLRHLAGDPRAPPKPGSPTPRVQARDCLARRGCGPVRDRRRDGSPGARRRPRGRLRPSHGNELLHPLDAARMARRAAGVQPHHVYLATEVTHA